MALLFWKYLLSSTLLSSAIAADVVGVNIQEGHSPFGEDLLENDIEKSEHKIFTGEELSRYNGVNTVLPLCMAINGVVFDVSSAKALYGPGQKYHALTGRDASRAVAKWSTDTEHLNSNLDGLTKDELKKLDDIFHNLFMKKYPVVNGYMRGSEPIEDNKTFRVEL